MVLIASLAFGLLALISLGAWMGNVRSPGVLENLHLVEDRESVRRTRRIATTVFGLAGLSFAVSALLIWSHSTLALGLGGWPIFLFGLLRATGHLTVISRLSTGE